MVNIFICFQEEKLFETTNPQIYYGQYFDDTFVMFSRSESSQFFHSVNQLHQALKFASEFENNCLHFLDVLVECVAVTYLFPFVNQCPHQAIRSLTDQSGAEHIDSSFLSRTIFPTLFGSRPTVREYLVSSQDRPLSRPLLRTFQMETLHGRIRCN